MRKTGLRGIGRKTLRELLCLKVKMTFNTFHHHLMENFPLFKMSKSWSGDLRKDVPFLVIENKIRSFLSLGFFLQEDWRRLLCGQKCQNGWHNGCITSKTGGILIILSCSSSQLFFLPYPMDTLDGVFPAWVQIIQIPASPYEVCCFWTTIWKGITELSNQQMTKSQT